MTKRVLALLLALVFVFTAAACGGSKDKDSSDPASTNTEGYGEGIGGGAVGKTEFKLPEYHPTDRIVHYLCTSDPKQLKDPSAFMYNINEKMKLEYGCELEYIRTTNEEYANKASQMVLSGNSPDIMVYREKDNPNFIINNLVQPVDDLIDFNEPLFAPIKELNENFRYNGKLYTLMRTYKCDGYSYWWTDDLAELGLESPRELFWKGEWTWSKFEEYARLLTVKGTDGTVTRFGGGFEWSLYPVTGEEFVKYSNGNYENNLRSLKLAEFFNFARKLIDDKIMPTSGVSIRSQFQEHNISIYLGQSNLLFNYMFEEQKAKEISWAPVPKWDSADKYYVPNTYSCTWIAAGAPNVQGALAYTAVYTLFNLNIDPDIVEAQHKLAVLTRGIDDEDSKLSNEITRMTDEGEMVLVQVHDAGLGVNWGSSQRGSFMNMIWNWNKSWAAAVEENYPLLNAAINEYEEQQAKNK